MVSIDQTDVITELVSLASTPQDDPRRPQTRAEEEVFFSQSLDRLLFWRTSQKMNHPERYTVNLNRFASGMRALLDITVGPNTR